MGMITGYTNYLESATTINPDRPNGFPFRDWHPHVVEKLLEVALSAFRIDALKWVTRQQNWQSIVKEDLVEKIICLSKSMLKHVCLWRIQTVNRPSIDFQISLFPKVKWRRGRDSNPRYLFK